MSVETSVTSTLSASATESIALSPYTVAVGDMAANTSTILKLWRGGLTHSGNPQAKLDWYYTGNVQGLPAVFFLNHQDEPNPVGVAAIGQREMRFNDVSIKAGALVDFVTVAEHRTLFPALLLQKELRQQGLASHRVLYGFPNPKSLAVVRRAGYSLAGQMVRRARVLRSALYVARHVPHWISRIVGPLIDTCRHAALKVRQLTRPSYKAIWLDGPDARFDELWANATLPNVLMGRRDQAFLAWRFTDNPTHKHSIFALIAEPSGSLVAYAVCEVHAKTLHVRDFLADPTIPNSMNSLWLHLITNAFTRGLAVLSVEFLGNRKIAREIEAAGLNAREQQPMYAAATAQWSKLLDENAWYLTSADKD